MGDSETKTIFEQFQFPVAVLAALQAGSIFYIVE